MARCISSLVGGSWRSRSSSTATSATMFPGSTCGSCTNAMIHSIANEVDDRIRKILNHRLVNFRVLAGEDEFHILAHVTRQITGDPRVLLEEAADRLHARLHHGVLQIRYQQVKLADRLVERVQCLVVAAPLQDVGAQAGQPVLGQADFTREVEHLIEPRGVDPNR